MTKWKTYVRGGGGEFSRSGRSPPFWRGSRGERCLSAWGREGREEVPRRVLRVEDLDQ